MDTWTHLTIRCIIQCDATWYCTQDEHDMIEAQTSLVAIAKDHRMPLKLSYYTSQIVGSKPDKMYTTRATTTSGGYYLAKFHHGRNLTAHTNYHYRQSENHNQMID